MTHPTSSGITEETTVSLHLDYAPFITRYDSPSTVFYLDPPYWNSENDYGKGLFSRDAFAEMAAQLATIKGRFLMSINDLPEVRATFGAFHLAGIETTYTVSKGATGSGAAKELLVSNFVIDPKDLMPRKTV